MSVGKLVFLIMQLLLKLFDLSFYFLNMIHCSRHSFAIFFFKWNISLFFVLSMKWERPFTALQNYWWKSLLTWNPLGSINCFGELFINHNCESFLSSIFTCICWISFWMKACRSSGLIEFATNKWDSKINQDSIDIVC